MPDDLRKKRPQDSLRINIHEPYEVSYWCNTLGCTEKELIDAVKAVGDLAEKVKEYLGR